MPSPIQPNDIDRAAQILNNGGLVAMPTETVYGLACDARNPDALQRLYTVKGRPGSHPVIVHIGDITQLPDWAIDIPDAAYRLAETFWPGPMTLVLTKHPDVPAQVTGGQETIGVRIPAHPVALQLLEAFGGGLAAPSANRFGRVSPTMADHVAADLGADVDLILDGGPCPVGVESTIIDLSGDAPRILRPGMITAEAIAACLNQPLAPAGPGSTETPRVPGSLESHYAPRARVALMGYQSPPPMLSARTAFLGWHPPGGPQLLMALRAPEDAPSYARALYASLRALDQIGCDIILVETPPDPDAPEWAAVMDRLRRAAR